MCSVVEIKNDSEYYIYYQSPESLETGTPQQSLEYHSLFKVNQSDKSDDESEHDKSQNDDITSTSPKNDDKDFSVEEIVADNVPEDTKVECSIAIVKREPGVGAEESEVVTSERVEEHVDDMTADHVEEDVNIHYDWTVTGWKIVL